MSLITTAPSMNLVISHDIAFGRAYELAFHALTQTHTFAELPLFRALADSLRLASTHVNAEEYHGASHQVQFNGDGINSRIGARCELSDLLIVVYSQKFKTARFTFLQAKSERAFPVIPAGWNYSANLEQWDLLSRRPSLAGIGQFNPPSDLLSAAVLPSIGSFGFFYGTASNGFQMLYASADILAPVFPHRVRYGKLYLGGNLLSHPPSQIRMIHGYPERTYTWGNFFFGRDLYGLRIGEPLITSGRFSGSSAARWVAAVISSLASTGHGDIQRGALLLQLAELLGESDPQVDGTHFGAKRMLLIGTDSPPEYQANHED